MSVATQSSWNPLEVPPVPVRRFTVNEYHQLIRSGFFDGDERFELLEGWIVPELDRSPSHAVSCHLADNALRQRIPAGWHLRVPAAITTTDSEPEPDIAVVRGSARDHLRGHPQPKDSGLVVEVADSSLAQDRELRARIYARGGVPVYWIVNLVDGQVEVHTNPTGPGPSPNYRDVRVFGRDESVALLIDQREIGQIAVRDLLP